jgi:hypothetical protein
MTSAIDTAHPPLAGEPWRALKLESWPAVALICLVSLVPLMVVEIPPLVDLYGHIGRYAVQTDLANRPELQPYYSYEWRLIGNLGADLLVELLHRVLGLEGAVRAVVALTQLLATLGILAVSRAVHGRITPFAIAALPLIYGYPFNYGFINFALGMALALLAFAAWVSLRARARPLAAALWLAVAGPVIWVCHTYGWAFLGLMCGAAMLADEVAARSHPFAAIRRILGACAPLLLPLVPMLLWRSEVGPSFTGTWAWFFKGIWLISALRTKWHDFDLASLGVIAALIVAAVFYRGTGFDRRVALAAALAFGCVAALPMYVLGSAFADMRMVPYAFILALLAIAPRRMGPWGRAAFWSVALGLFVVRAVGTAAAYVAHARPIAAAVPTLEAIPRGSRVALFVVNPCPAKWALPVLDHLGGLALARRSVFINDQWYGPGMNPLSIHHPIAGPFAHDPSQVVIPDGCRRKSLRLQLSRALTLMPRAAFTHVWIIGEVRSAQKLPPDLVPLPHRGKGLLLAVRR